jgi:hypothetical protein
MSSFRMLVCGGSAVAPAMIDAAREKWGVPVLQGWGMTETSPLCALSHPPRNPGPGGETPWRAKSGRPVSGVQVRVVDDAGEPLPHDGASVGELQLHGTSHLIPLQPMAGCEPAMSVISTNAISSSSPTAPRMSSSQAVSGFHRSTLKMSYSHIPTSPRWRSSPPTTNAGRSVRWHW